MTGVTWALAAVIVVGFPAMAGACFYLVWRLCERHAKQIDDVMDRIQAPEAAHVAAYEQFVPRPPGNEFSDATYPPVELDEDFRLAEILEGV